MQREKKTHFYFDKANLNPIHQYEQKGIVGKGGSLSGVQNKRKMQKTTNLKNKNTFCWNIWSHELTRELKTKGKEISQGVKA